MVGRLKIKIEIKGQSISNQKDYRHVVITEDDLEGIIREKIGPHFEIRKVILHSVDHKSGEIIS